MELLEALRARRSVRKYKRDPLPEQTVRDLLELAAWAPNGMNNQPWAFVVIEEQKFLKSLSDRAKTSMLERIKVAPALERYRGALSSPDFNIFYEAPALVVIYGDPSAHTYINDCSMAAQNLMLAAWDKGIGSCWIGFSVVVLNTPEVKKELKVPENYQLVAPIILGYPEGATGKGARKEVRVVEWKK